MCLVIGVGLAQFSLKYAVGFVFTTVPVTGLISIVSMFQERESKETAIVAGLIQGTVAFLTATLAVVGIIILTVIAILVAIVAALLEVCSSIMPNGTP